MTQPETRDISMSDIPSVLQLMKEFAIFDGSADSLDIDVGSLANAYFKTSPDMHALVALIDGLVVGFLNYTFSFSSFELKYCLWVEDVFIQEDYRRRGIGEALFARVHEIAKEKDCKRLEWLVRKDNDSGIDFYKKINATVDPGTIYVKWPIT